ncbi:xanthine dehydrogenase accessory protein XdhC [Mesorhizobium sp. KR2-14]|uniref:xanthine dehydrogenase accessory protein XdhC n=1 Tax=Mesorhizobium sp. KR2-14 TaxID=3156610 RepID=UPI0032B4FF65
MTRNAERLRCFLDTAQAAALVEVTEAKGSTPRETGTRMLVSPQAIFGTIGGGQLEFMAIDRARQMLAGSSPSAPRADLSREGVTLDIPLGPEIGQCCGGRVGLTIRPVEEALRAELIAQAKADDAASPHVYVFGGGHVGHAMAAAFALLPVQAVVVETRADALEGMPDAVETRLTPVPEEMVREAPAGSAFVVLTHDHALDFLIVAEALKREDAAYVGMIGSRTKKATFKSWFIKTAGGTEETFARLVTPIGGDAVKDKRPAVIAALAAAEIMTALVAHGTDSSQAHQGVSAG